jgi:hypothetical protein
MLMSLETIGLLMMIMGVATVCAVGALYIFEHNEFR